MKNLLLTLSSISALTLGSASSFVVANNNKNINIKNKLNTNENRTLFNSYYGALGFEGKQNNWWITNYSVSDSKFYSYNLQHANYLLSDNKTYAYSLFSVDSSDSDGVLHCDTSGLSGNDKAKIENTKTEIENDKKVNSTGHFNDNSRSDYSNSYFSNGNWQYIQFGGIENHVDISSQTNANKVDNYKDLNENLGLYYIAKAVNQQKIDENVADTLAQYFINHSSLAGKINNNLTNQIIKLLVHNSKIYNFIYSTPFNNSSKNYSLNFIFDSNNNLIELAYFNNKLNGNNSLNYSYSHSYGVWNDSDSSNQYNLINWAKYAPSWDSFVAAYATFSFSSSHLKFGCGCDIQENDNLNAHTNQIKTSQGDGDTNSVFALDLNEGLQGGAHLSLDIWRNGDILMWKWFYWSTNLNIDVDISLSNVSFNNSMS